MLRFGLLGYRISYSLSPIIHNTVFKSLGFNAIYELIDVKPEEFNQKIQDIFRNYHGFNITIPYKVVITQYVNSLSNEAYVTGSVNTVKIENQVIQGFNTDVFGIYKSIIDNRIDLNRLKVLILGAGGVARSVIYVMNLFNVSKIIIVNRTLERALEVRNWFKRFEIEVEVYPWDKRFELCNKTDVIINCTPIGTLSSESPLPDYCIQSNHIVIDLVYRPRITQLLKYAIRKGCKIVDGISILIYQALKADEIWLNRDDIIRKDIFEKILNVLKQYDQSI